MWKRNSFLMIIQIIQNGWMMNLLNICLIPCDLKQCVGVWKEHSSPKSKKIYQQDYTLGKFHQIALTLWAENVNIYY